MGESSAAKEVLSVTLRSAGGLVTAIAYSARSHTVRVERILAHLKDPFKVIVGATPQNLADHWRAGW
jgi:hypothetical protein